jgi:transcriptional antiterminator RfaH
MYKETKSLHWYVAYTFPNTEKSIQRTLMKLQIDSFLPLYAEVRNWSDRRKVISAPLFPGYIFIYSTHSARYEALGVKGIIKYVSFGGKPAIIKDEHIESIKKIILGEFKVHERANLTAGAKIRVMEGPFTGAEGILQRVNGSTRLFILIECLNRSVSVNIQTCMVASIPEEKKVN